MNKVDVYMRMAEEISNLSPDEETQVGAIMLSKDGRIIAASFNGFLRGAPDDKLPCTRPKKHEYVQHAERNLLYNCAFEGIKTRETVIVCTLSPCLECLRACFASGVRTIVFKDLYSKFESVDMYKLLPDVCVLVSMIGDYVRLDMETIDELEKRSKESWG